MELRGKHDEYSWIEAFRIGDSKALAHFFDLYHRPLCYFVKRLIHNDAEAEDIVAECFVKLWDRKANFETERNIKSFLFISCRNASLDFFKKLKRRSIEEVEYQRQLEESDVGILNTVIESEFLNTLYEEIQLLPEQCRKVFSLIYFDRKKTDEVSRLMGISVKTVRNHKARAIQLLHNSFLKKGVSETLLFAVFIFLNKKY